MTADYARLLPPLCAIAREAGEVILDHYRGEGQVRRKRDATPVTDADDASERLILERLAALAPDIPAISEEAVSRGHVPALSPGKPYFLVDPLDGTREFIARNGEFAVNIGLVLDRRPILGVVHGPALGVTYAGVAPSMAFMSSGGGPHQPIRARKPPAEGLVALTSRSHGDRTAVAAFLSDLTILEHRRLGSALKFGIVAAGEADIYVRLGRTMEWDTAAGHAIVAAAGGSVTTLAGEPFLYGKPGFENGDFVVRGAA